MKIRIVDMIIRSISEYVKAMHKQYNLTQVELSEKSGVGIFMCRGLL